MGPLGGPGFRALVDQAKRICPAHPDLLPAYLAVTREKGKGIPPEELRAIEEEVARAGHGTVPRGALARALVYQPPVLLLDEPLSNLDPKLREEARSWLRQLILQLQISAVYITHDQVEAMAVADRVLFLRDGRIEQEGTPQEMYERPASAITADFMGSNNRLTGTLGTVAEGRGRLEGDSFALWGKLLSPIGVGASATGFTRLERTRLAQGPGENRLAMRLETSLYLGERWEYLLTRGSLRVRAWGREPLHPGERWVEFLADDLWLF